MKKIYFLFVFIFSLNLFSQEISDSLLIKYNFDGDFIDASGNSFDGTNFGATFIEDRFGRPDSAVYFNGIDNYLLFPNLDELKPQLPVSFSFWVKYDSMDGDYAYLLSTSFEYDRSSGIYFNTQLSTDKYAVNYGDGTYYFNPITRRTYISESVIDTEDWHHVAVIVNSALDMKIYVDCKENGGEYIGSGGDLVYSDYPGNLGRGRRNGNAGINYFKGALDDFYYWKRALTEDEIPILCDRGQMNTQEYEKEKLRIVPNPVDEVFTLNSKAEIISYVIYNSYGQVVMNRPFMGKSINVSGLPSGVYYIKLNTENEEIVSKFIKK